MRTPAIAVLFALTACSGGSFDPADFEGGMFAITTTGVDDRCADGSFDVIFMPEGTDEAWDVAMELPSVADLPTTYDVTAPAPYGQMTVTAQDGGTGRIDFAETTQDGVLIDDDTYPGCTADITVSGSLTIVDADHVQGSITLDTANYTGEQCPQVTTDPCSVTLDLTGQRS